MYQCRYILTLHLAAIPLTLFLLRNSRFAFCIPDLPPLAVPVDWQEVRLKTGPALQATLRVYP